MNDDQIKQFLDQKVEQFNRPAFIPEDPIAIPHLFAKKEDIEIMGLWAAVLAWGQRTTIINKSKELIRLMDGAPHDFILNHKERDLKRFEKFAHRTFNATDALYFLHFFRNWYSKYDSLEPAFADGIKEQDATVANGLEHFHNTFFKLDHPRRTKKHIANPAKGSTCKRINMFLRWMVRKDDKGVDFGIWNRIKPSQLLCPVDVHVNRVARELGLVERKQTDFKAVLELTQTLRELDPDDPVKYDFALFGIGRYGINGII